MFSNILVPLDGSKEAEKALSYAGNIAKLSGATIHLLHVIEHLKQGVRSLRSRPEDRPSELDLDLERKFEQGQIEEEMDYLGHLATHLKESDVTTVIAEVELGNPDDHILNYAQSNGIDLIIINPHGHRGFRNFFVGSTTDRIVRSAEIPVMVVHTR